MLELHYEQDGNYLKKVHVTRDGIRVGTELPTFSTSFEWSPAVSTDVDAQAILRIVGDFVFLVSNNSPVYSQIVLCLFEEERSQRFDSLADGVRIWPVKPLVYSPGPHYNQKLEHHIDLLERFISFEGAVYVSVNPAGVSHSVAFLEKGKYVDTTSKGRWLFPHPDGSRAAFEHLQKTTLEDDLERLMPHFEEHPELMETFSDLI